MIIHLELGACLSETDNIDLNESAALCLGEDYRKNLLERRDLEREYSKAVHPLRYPEYDTSFTKLSALFQHVCTQARWLNRSDASRQARIESRTTTKDHEF